MIACGTITDKSALKINIFKMYRMAPIFSASLNVAGEASLLNPHPFSSSVGTWNSRQ